MTEDEITAKIRADLEKHVFARPEWQRLRDRTVVPDAPCATCGGSIFWRKVGTLPIHCSSCEPCADPAPTAYWYIAGTPLL